MIRVISIYIFDSGIEVQSDLVIVQREEIEMLTVNFVIFFSILLLSSYFKEMEIYIYKDCVIVYIV